MLDIFKTLNDKQKEVVRNVEGSFLIMSPVGTGKTKVIVYRAVNAIQNNIDPSKILCLSFTNKASKEIKERIISYIGKDTNQIDVRTFHSLCAYIIRSEAEFVGIDSDFTIYDEEDSKEILNRIWRKHKIRVSRNDYDRFNSFLFEVFQNVKLLPYSNVSHKNLNDIFYNSLSNTYLENTDKFQQFCPEKIFEEYNRELSDNHALDFADLIVNVIKLFNENPKILSKWQNTYQFIQVDEFQDINISEYEIISQLAKSHKNLSFFGDIDQTIYEWRGSAPFEIKERFKKEFAPVKEISFVKNYRSTKNILFACESFIKQYRNAVTKEIEIEVDEIGEKLGIYCGIKIPDEVHWISSKIEEIREKYGICYKDIAILTRTNYLSRDISELLEKKKIPHFLIDYFKFFRRAEIKDALAHLRFLINRYDTNSLLRILKRPPKGIGEVTIDKIRTIPRDIGLKLVDFVNPLTFQFMDPFGMLIKKWSENKVVVFDVETTGTNILEDEIIEIAGLKVGIDGVVDTFHKYIKNSKPVGESFKIHNISDSELATVGEEPEKVFKEFIGFIKNCLLVGHNVHFDISIFKSELKRLGFESIEVGHYYDTLEITRRFFPLRRYNLEYICKELNIFKKPIHRAREDTEATNELLKILIRYIQNKKQLREKFVEEYYKQFEFLSKQLEKWKIDMEKNRPPILLQNILEESGLIEYWERQEDGLKRIMNFRELISLFRRYDDEIFLPSEALINILNITSLSQDVDRYLQHDDRVLLLTVHQAKGLEFDTVFIAGATDNEFPSFRSQEEGRLDEEHRLFYVAMSRAKKRLFITYHQMNKSGRLQERSRFIDMIPEEVKYINCKSSNT